MRTDYEVFWISTGLLVLSWFIRGIIARKFSFYWFIVWNIFLAILPLLPLLCLVSLRQPQLFVSLLLSGLFLLFLPNTYYLITDLMHLNPDVLVNERNNSAKPSLKYTRGDAWFVVDGFLLFLTVLLSSIVGGFALNRYYLFLQNNYSNIANLTMLFVVVACAIGVYIGRYGRWNSWDVFIKPHKIIVDLLHLLKDKAESSRLVVFVGCIIVFELFSWVFVAKII